MSSLTSLVGAAGRCLNAICKGLSAQSAQLLQPLNVSSDLQQVRNHVHRFFPRPSEHKRITKHGFKQRISTKSGRRVLFRRMLKGRHVLSH
uniref:Large ribosomal subunit protein bL34m n=1 Tax=Hyalomma excavatum TaxID=257692 RepID=A0A131XS37_9ACAR